MSLLRHWLSINCLIFAQKESWNIHRPPPVSEDHERVAIAASLHPALEPFERAAADPDLCPAAELGRILARDQLELLHPKRLEMPVRNHRNPVEVVEYAEVAVSSA